MTAVRRFVVLPLAAWAFLSCSNQSEGERCDPKSGNDDCQANLVCTEIGATAVYRCCPATGTSTDSRCQAGPTNAGGSSGGGGVPGGGGSSGATTGGTAGAVSSGGTAGSASATCTHNSDCAVGLVCGPTGKCQVECVVDRDCTSPLVCRSSRCVAAGGAGGAGGAP